LKTTIDLALVEKALECMRKEGQKYEEAKNNRKHLERYRKVKKASLMREKAGNPGHVCEAYAYSHPDYIEVLDGIKEAGIIEDALLWKLKAAELTAEVWRSISATNRQIDNSHR